MHFLHLSGSARPEHDDYVHVSLPIQFRALHYTLSPFRREFGLALQKHHAMFARMQKMQKEMTQIGSFLCGADRKISADSEGGRMKFLRLQTVYAESHTLDSQYPLSCLALLYV